MLLPDRISYQNFFCFKTVLILDSLKLRKFPKEKHYLRYIDIDALSVN